MPSYDPWKGRTIRELLDISPTRIGSMGRRELGALVSKMASVANKRIANLRKLPYDVPSLYDIDKEGGKFGARGKTESQLIMEYQRMKKFFESGTGTVREAKAHRKSLLENLADRFGKEEDFFSGMGEEREREFWNLFHELEPRAKALGISTTNLIDVVNNALSERRTFEDRKSYGEQELNRLYEEAKEKRRQQKRRYRAARANRM